jgi:uncharacterized membrane protein YjgN (DUF898 family)
MKLKPGKILHYSISCVLLALMAWGLGTGWMYVKHSEWATRHPYIYHLLFEY